MLILMLADKLVEECRDVGGELVSDVDYGFGSGGGGGVELEVGD